MSVEASVRDEDRWFVGERKILLFAVAGVPDGETAESWASTYTFYTRAGRALFAKPVEAAGTALLSVTVAATDTAALEPGIYHHVLRRTDADAEQILAFGPVVLRDPTRP